MLIPILLTFASFEIHFISLTETMFLVPRQKAVCYRRGLGPQSKKHHIFLSSDFNPQIPRLKSELFLLVALILFSII